LPKFNLTSVKIIKLKHFFHLTQNNNNKETKKNYESFLGVWENKETLNNINIKKITDDEITFTWFVYRLGGIDEDTTITLENGKAIFYYEGCDDKNYDSNCTEDEKFIRKATISLTDDGVNIFVEAVNSIENSYKFLDNVSGAQYIETQIHTHPTKIS